MKSEWEFQFETRDFHFEKEHKFLATANNPVLLGEKKVEQLEVAIKIVPRDATPPPFVEQLGSMFITLPYSKEESKSFAYYVAQMMEDRITFQSGDFRIRYGLVKCKRIAETPEEEMDFGDRLYSIEGRVVEIIPTPSFNSEVFKALPSYGLHAGLISQYNETKRDTSPIRQFLGFFKILESLYHTGGKRQTLKQALLDSTDLQMIYTSLVKDDNFEGFANDVVEIRHRCAHLKLGAGFGYLPADPAIESEVKPYLPLLEDITYACIIGAKHSSSDS
jgi:hypothetical protein